MKRTVFWLGFTMVGILIVRLVPFSFKIFGVFLIVAGVGGLGANAGVKKT